MSTVQVLLTRIDPGVPMPTYAHPGDAGADLVTTSDAVLRPGERVMVGTGIAIALPPGYAGFVHPRSGLAARVGLSVVNTPGTIDAGYRGEIRVCLINHDPAEPVELARGDRIAQLIVQRVETAEFVEVEALDASVRGDGGYGSTGGHATLDEGGLGACPQAGSGGRTPGGQSGLGACPQAGPGSPTPGKRRADAGTPGEGARK
ncbi:MAG TPA: dUTP diphosphatase [Amycolatopsis sp.]|nr:dUTP diphosphatase [Amycolatopsis sp.]HKS47590.1 dUTP diphosphatase [Amycolatopsis sp.]